VKQIAGLWDQARESNYSRKGRVVPTENPIQPFSAQRNIVL